MKAPAKARQAHAQKSKDGTLTQGVVVPFRNAAEKFAKWRKPDSESTDKVRLSRARMAAEALPVSGGYRTAPSDPSQPTPQRRAKNNRAPLQPYSGKWPPEVEIAFARFLVESEVLSQYNPKVTISYEGGGSGSDPSRRFGGLGGVPERVRQIHRRYQFIRRNLSIKATHVLDKLVLAMPSESDGSTCTLQQMGRYIFPHIRDVATSKGVSLGFLLSIGEQLDILYAEYERDHRDR